MLQANTSIKAQLTCIVVKCSTICRVILENTIVNTGAVTDAETRVPKQQVIQCHALPSSKSYTCELAVSVFENVVAPRDGA